MSFDAHANFAYSTVATAPSPASSGTSLVVASGDGTKFPAVPFNATVWPASSQPTTANAEIVRVTNISTDTFTITRTQESTSARAISVGDQIAATITQKVITDIEAGATGGGKLVDSATVTSGNITVTATTSAAADTVITGSGFTADGTSKYLVEFFSPAVRSGVSDGAIVRFLLQEGATIIGIFGAVETPNSLSSTKATLVPVLLRYLVTPSAASHTYKVTAYNFVGASANIGAGAGGDGSTNMAALLTVTKLA